MSRFSDLCTVSNKRDNYPCMNIPMPLTEHKAADVRHPSARSRHPAPGPVRSVPCLQPQPSSLGHCSCGHEGQLENTHLLGSACCTQGDVGQPMPYQIRRYVLTTSQRPINPRWRRQWRLALWRVIRRTNQRRLCIPPRTVHRPRLFCQRNECNTARRAGHARRGSRTRCA